MLLIQIQAVPVFAGETNASMISMAGTVESNATSILENSADRGDSVISLNNQTVNYYGDASGYLVFPTGNALQRGQPQPLCSQTLQSYLQ